MDIDFYFLLVLTILISSIKCNSDLNTVLNSDDGHFYESSVYKYSEQGNIKQSVNMNNNNNIFLSIISINLIPIIIIFFLIPITILRRYQLLLITFLSFTSGGIMADVFLRLFPNMMISDTNIEHYQHENRTGLFILIGIFLSFIIEKFFRYFQNDDEERNSTSSINILAYLFLLVDILHYYTNSLNFSSILLVKSTINSNVMITKILYQILHVLYGYAILIHSGWTSGKAMRFQFLAGLIGPVFCLGSLQFPSHIIVELWSNQILIPIISGIFVYISTVHIIPEVTEHNSGIKGTFFKVSVCIVSVIIIFYLNKYEELFI